MKFLNKLYTKAIFSEDSSLNVVAGDMGEGQIQLAISEDVVRRLPTATGTVGSLAIYVPTTINISLLKTSAIADVFLQRALDNGYIGGSVTIYDDTNRPWTIYDPSIGTAEFSPSNGTDPQVTVRIDGNSLVNSQALVGA